MIMIKKYKTMKMIFLKVLNQNNKIENNNIFLFKYNQDYYSQITYIEITKQ